MALKHSRSVLVLSPLSLAFVLAGCGDRPGQIEPEHDQARPEAELIEPETSVVHSPAMPADAFLDRIARHCGEAFEGRIVANEPPRGEEPPADDPFVGQRLLMHVRECGEGELKIPFHVGDNHSRTWILTRTGTGLRLKHDHRKEDGSDDPLTMYGGESDQPGTEVRQEFPVDQESIDLFNELGYEPSVVNTWAMEIEPGERFLYELSRPSGRMFQVEFDLTTPVDTPPTPWGHE
jgi:hypothetical protein